MESIEKSFDSNLEIEKSYLLDIMNVSAITGDTEAVEKAFSNIIEKGKPANIGEIRDWNGEKFRKIGPGKWEAVSEQRFTGREDQSVRTGIEKPKGDRVGKETKEEKLERKKAEQAEKKAKRAERTAENKKQRQEDRKNDPSYKWNPAKYNKWIEDAASISDGQKVDVDYASDMADNASMEAGLIEYVERQIRKQGGDEDAYERIQWDIEAKIPDSAYRRDEED